MADDENLMVKNRSMLKDFLASAATMSGDLSNITAPPFVLDTRSVIEMPTFWAENPSIFVSPSQSDDPVERALRILRSFLSGMRSQCYMGHAPEDGVKKPMNAFLGELFIGKWEDDNGTTHMLSEQVSHHPPITACRVWNDKHGVIAEGYNRQKITFNGSVNIECVGHILKTLTKYDEHYLMPIPDFKVKGVLSTPYPEISDTYYIPSTSGYTSVVHFSEKSWFSSSSQRHGFTAHLYKEDEGESNPLYTIEGQWDTEFTIRDNRKRKDIEVFQVETQVLKDVPQLIVDPIEKQDPWESRRAWHDTVKALKKGDMKGIGEAKGRIEEGQREMRADEQKRGVSWEPLFFQTTKRFPIVEQLNEKVPDEDFRKSKGATEGVWTFKPEAWKTVKKPYHGSLRPDNTQTSQNDSLSPTYGQHGTERAGDGASVKSRRSSMKQPGSPRTNRDIHFANDVPSSPRDRTSMDSRRSGNFTAGSNVNGQSSPTQSTRKDVHSRLGSGIEGMSIEEKHQIENMIRDQHSTATRDRRSSRAARNSSD